MSTIFLLLALFDEQNSSSACHLIKKREEGRCLVLVTFLYSVDFVLYNDVSECHAPVCSDEAYANEYQEQGRMS